VLIFFILRSAFCVRHVTGDFDEFLVSAPQPTLLSGGNEHLDLTTGHGFPLDVSLTSTAESVRRRYVCWTSVCFRGWDDFSNAQNRD
jgi:hypothetical protein